MTDPVTQALIKEEQELILRNAFSLIHKYCDSRWRIFSYATREVHSLCDDGVAHSDAARLAIDSNIALADAVLAMESRLTAALLKAAKEPSEERDGGQA